MNQDLMSLHIESSDSQIEVNKKIETLADEVIEKIGNPISPLQVAAVIESLGYRNVDCPVEFGKKDVFELGIEVYWICKRKMGESVRTSQPRGKISYVLKRVLFFIKHYLNGIFFGLPIITQIAFIILTGYSLWAWVKFNELQATLVAFGTILGFVVTGGFIQVIGKELTHYLSMGNRKMARDIAFLIFDYAVVITALTAFIVLILNLIFEFFPLRFLHVSLGYYFFISVLLVLSGILYAARNGFSIVIIFSIGTLVVICFHKCLDFPIHLAHILGLLFASVSMYVWSKYVLRFKDKGYISNYISLKIKRPSVFVYVNSSFFKFGFYYFLLLFLDRIVSWSTHSGFYFFWFRTPYELGVDWALLSFGLMLAMLEYIVNDFAISLEPTHKMFSALRLRDYVSYYYRFYIHRFILLFLFGILSIILVYFVVTWLGKRYIYIKEVREFFSSPITVKVYFIASIAYLLMSIGLMNNLYFFTLWKVELGLSAIRNAVVIDLLVGILASRLISWEYGVLGFLAGAFYFAIASTRYMLKFIHTLDYQYYSAF